MRAPQAGFLTTELGVGLGLISTVILIVFGVLSSGQAAYRRGASASDVDDQLRAAAWRMAEELRCASEVGEDINLNGTLDAGEDLNGNGRLEADWMLTASEVTFNRRLGDGRFSLPITYRMSGDRLERLALLPGGETARTVVARAVTQFVIAQTGKHMTIDLRLDGGEAGGRRRKLTVFRRN
jgi:hypothetical protein